MSSQDLNFNNEYFKTRYAFNAGRNKVWRAIVEYLGKYIPNHGTVLDLGAGYCDFINQVKSKNRIALDINPTAGEFAQTGVQFLSKPISALRSSDLPGPLDVVFASNFFEHFTVNETLEILGQLKELMSRDAKLILMQPNYYYAYRNYWDDYTHKTAFTHTSLSDLLTEAGFEMLCVEKRFVPFSFKSRLPTSYWLTKIYLSLPYRPMAKQMMLVARKK